MYDATRNGMEHSIPIHGPKALIASAVEPPSSAIHAGNPTQANRGYQIRARLNSRTWRSAVSGSDNRRAS